MCHSVSSFYTCNCPGENYIQRCKCPHLKCIEDLREPTSFTQNVARGLSSSHLTRRLSNRSTVPPRTPISANNAGRRASTSSSIYSDSSIAPSTRSRSARSRAESYIKFLDLGPLSLKQSASLAEAQATLRKSIAVDNQRRASEAEVFDNEIEPCNLSHRPWAKN